jgi:hypothetical protein
MQEDMENGTFFIVISLLSHARRYGKRTFWIVLTYCVI